MIKRKTWKLSERPGSYGKQRERVHPQAHLFDKITKTNQVLFMLAKRTFMADNPTFEGTIYAYGSRVNGNFVEASDVDLAITTPPANFDLRAKKYTIKFKEQTFTVDIKPIDPDPKITYLPIP